MAKPLKRRERRESTRCLVKPFVRDHASQCGVTQGTAGESRECYGSGMKKLAAVEEARAVMIEAADWGVWKWLLEKSRVQEIADRATSALAKADSRAKAGWSEELKKAYEELGNHPKGNGTANGIAPELRLVAQKVKAAYEKGQRARVDAEQTFREADRRMSTDRAREGARKALESYDLRERAIRKAEEAGKSVLK